jgi:hypothetical protein
VRRIAAPSLGSTQQDFPESQKFGFAMVSFGMAAARPVHIRANLASAVWFRNCHTLGRSKHSWDALRSLVDTGALFSGSGLFSFPYFVR